MEPENERGKLNMPRKVWTDDRNFYLINHYPKAKSLQRLAEKLGVSENAMIHQASRLGIKREIPIVRCGTGRPWTDKDWDTLRRKYSEVRHLADLAIEMDHPISTIQEYAKKIGLTRKTGRPRTRRKIKVCRPKSEIEWSTWEINFLWETHDILHWRQMQRNGLKRTAGAIVNQLITQGLHGKHLKRVRSYKVIFYYRTEEELRQKWDYVNFWKEVTEHDYATARRNGCKLREGIAGISKACG